MNHETRQRHRNTLKEEWRRSLFCCPPLSLSLSSFLLSPSPIPSTRSIFIFLSLFSTDRFRFVSTWNSLPLDHPIDLFPVSRGSLAPSLPPHPLNFLVTRSQNHLLPRNRLQRLKETKFLDRTFLSRTRRQESPVEDRGKSGRSDAESVERMKVFTLQGSTSSFASLSLRLLLKLYGKLCIITKETRFHPIPNNDLVYLSRFVKDR